MYSIFEQLLKQNKKTAYQVGKATGIATSTLSDWKKGKSTPKADKLAKIADYFDVSTDYLLGKTDQPHINVPATLSDRDKEILEIMELFERLTPENKAKADDYLDLLLKTQDDES